ncbi:MAG TPA: MFS transporter [Bryobacteraceae bacterium]|jgi:ACS family hexuronate transporter-like MFS transporter|nr:MFS transporter [Bryobacteraceae bacterium]
MKNRRRWWIVWTLFFSTAINYINRQTLSVLAPVISKEFHLNHSQLSNIFGAFQFAYAGTWLIGGIFLDVVGTRIGLSIAVIWWSLVSIATSFANSAFSFGALRFMLGIGEGFNWPGASKAVAEHFPAPERSVAVAIFDSGSSIGGAVAAIAIPWIALKMGWRYAFTFSGVLGFVWLALWLLIYPRSRSQAQQRTAASLDLRDTKTWLPLLKRGETWGIVLGRSLTDPIWWFYVFWLPQYFSDTRGFSLKQIAAFTWIPFVAADLGNFAGGLSSGALIKHGMPVIRARKWVCIVSSIPILAGIPAVLNSNPYFSLALICLALFGYASWSTMGLTLPSDLFPPEVVGSVTGLSGLAAGLSGTLFTLLVGKLVDHFSYLPAFVVAATAPVLATLSVLLLIRNTKRPGSDVVPRGPLLETV